MKHRRSHGNAMPDEARARRHTLGPIAFIVSIMIVIIIYLLARNRQLNHGDVPTEKEFWKMHGGVPRQHGHHYRHRD